MNPSIDASDKEIFSKNGFKSAGKNLVSFLKNGDQAGFLGAVYRPKNFGELTKDNQGQTHTITSNLADHHPKFKVNGKKLGVGLANGPEQVHNSVHS